MTSNLNYTFWDSDGGEAAATFECTASNRSHTLGDGDGSEATAIIEGSSDISSDAAIMQRI